MQQWHQHGWLDELDDSARWALATSTAPPAPFQALMGILSDLRQRRPDSLRQDHLTALDLPPTPLPNEPLLDWLEHHEIRDTHDLLHLIASYGARCASDALHYLRRDNLGDGSHGEMDAADVARNVVQVTQTLDLLAHDQAWRTEPDCTRYSLPTMADAAAAGPAC